MVGPTIIVVEDEGIVARDIQHRLEGIGYNVPEIASTGAEAVSKALELKPDVVLMDIMLRGPMDGIEAAARIREKMDIPVVFVTAYAEEEVLKRARVTEPYGYIVKPFEDRELQAAVEIALYRHRAERKLAESERRYRALVTSLEEGILMADAEENIVYANPSFCEMLGYREDQLVRMNLGQLMPEEDLEKMRRETSRRQQGRRGRCDVRMMRNGAELRSMQLSPTPWKNEMGQFLGTISAVLDQTEARYNEARLRASESRYRLLAENAADVIWTMNPNMVITYVSPSVERFLGYSSEQMANLRPRDYLSASSLDMLMEAMEKLSCTPSGPAPKVLELEYLRRDGSAVPSEVVLTAISDDRAEASSILGVTRDISARRRAEQELRERTEFLEEVIDTATEGIMVLNAGGDPVLLNAAARDILGEGLDEWLQRFTAENAGGREQLERALDGEQLSFDTGVKGREGTERAIRVTLTPMRFSGRPHVLGIIHETTGQQAGGSGQ